MGKRIIKLTEQDLKRIIDKVLVEQSQSISSRIESHPLLKKIISGWDGNIETLTTQTKKVLPRLDKKKLDDLLGKIIRMSKEEQNDFIKKNSSVVELSEQTSEGGWGGLSLLLGVFFAWVIYQGSIDTTEKVNIQRTLNKKKKEEELQKLKDEEERKKQEELDRIQKEKEEYQKLYGEIENLNGKTINLYLDPLEQKIVKKIKISDIKFTPRISGSSYLTFSESGLPSIVYTIACNYNPSKFEDRIMRETATGSSDFTKKIVAILDNPSYDAKFVYNKKFTNELNSRFSNFCKKPEADFSVVRKSGNNKMV